MIINDIPINIVKCFVVTVILECGLAFIIGLRKKDLINSFLVNLLTNPLLNAIVYFIYFRFKHSIYIGVLIALEILVIPIEGLIYKKTLENKKINSFLLSLILNQFSFWIGQLFL